MLPVAVRAQAPTPTVDPAQSTPVAPLVGPQYTPAAGQAGIGFYGTDLGFTVEHQGQLRVIFGDSWAGPLTPTIGPLGDDCQGTICLEPAGCPDGGVAIPDGDALEAYVGSGSPFFARPGPPLVFRENLFGLVAPLPVYAGGFAFGTLLDMGPLKTPVAAFSNGKSGGAAGVFAVFARGEAVPCAFSCSEGFSCDRTLGADADGLACVDGSLGCLSGPFDGICVDTQSPRYAASPAQARLRGAATRLRIGNADPAIEEQYYTQGWVSHRFMNLSTTTVDGYAITAGGVGDATVGDPSPADGSAASLEKVFLFGRPSFVGTRANPANLYFAVASVPSYHPSGAFTWNPRFYSGTNTSGQPTFSYDESDAAPLEDVNGNPVEPLDIVNQHSVRYVTELGKWVMIYGGDLDAALLDVFSQGQGNDVIQDPQGAMQIRFADQPWGPWTEPTPLLIAGDRTTGNALQFGPGGAIHHGACAPPGQCLPGEPLWDIAFATDFTGFLYGANLIPQWTEDRGATVDIYWNASTFAPYQVVLFKSTLTK